jgi:decaprenylphospho-beta-D-ribofuranose 2-oxidase
MTSIFAKKTFKCFDGSERASGNLFTPEQFNNLKNAFLAVGRFVPQGACLSYAPLSIANETNKIPMRGVIRGLNFDKTNGIIEIEAGMTLGQLAQETLPHYWYLKVQPGHPSITLGGCLGADVHGKNQFQDLNFKEQVLFLKLYHPDHGMVFCDRSQNSEAFHLTCGGYGLTGVVVSIGIQLGQLSSPIIESETLPLENIFDLPKALKERSLTDDLIYSWHDFNKTKNWGHGFLKVGRYKKSLHPGDWDLKSDLIKLENVKALESESRGPLPINLLCPLSVYAMNLAYSQKEMKAHKKGSLNLLEFLFPVLNKTIYFDLFGKSGFHETQVLIPFDRFEHVMTELKSGIKKFHTPVTLASCKLFKGQPELIRFIGEGIVLAFNLPRNSESLKLLNWWDQVIIENKCLPNISKDSRLPLKVFESCYPQHGDFKSGLLKWDPKRIFQSSTSQRLQL